MARPITVPAGGLTLMIILTRLIVLVQPIAEQVVIVGAPVVVVAAAEAIDPLQFV